MAAIANTEVIMIGDDCHIVHEEEAKQGKMQKSNVLVLY
jgi:hypothetical protein